MSRIQAKLSLIIKKKIKIPIQSFCYTELLKMPDDSFTKYGLIKIAFEASTKYPKYPKAKIFQNKSY